MSTAVVAVTQVVECVWNAGHSLEPSLISTHLSLLTA